MNESLASLQETQRACCEFCGKTVTLARDVDGVGRLREDGPLRYSHHAGNQWGRPCRGSGEQYTGDEP